MKTGKKVSITILLVLILALCAVGIIRSTTFPLDPATLPDHICDFYNIGRPQPLSPSIRVYDSVELENTVWYLIEIGEDIDLGYVKLERNILGRYKIVHLGYGGGSFRDGVVRSGEKAPQLGDYDFDRSTLRFYDKDGNDITAEYNLSGGGIQ